jgi:regulator of sigma E protease
VIYLVAFLGIIVLIFIHELGHFTAALAVGIRPRGFYVGFGPLLGRVRRNGIEYGLRAIPAGGYVRLPGMHRPAAHDFEAWFRGAMQEAPDLAPTVQRIRRALDAEDFAAVRADLPTLEQQLERAQLTPGSRRLAKRAYRDVEEGTSPDAYWRAATWKRVTALFAGPLANIIAAFLIFLIVFATGAPDPNRASTKVGAVERNTPAFAAGLRPGDRVVAVNGKPTPTFERTSALIRGSKGSAITVTVDRDGRKLVLGPRKTIRSGDRWIFGFIPAAETVHYSLGESAGKSANACWLVVKGTVQAFGALFHSKERGQLTSTVGIVRISAAALKVDFNYYLQIVGLVSMSLALLNLLPFLPLDGGHILFSLIEGVRRRALAREVYERVSVVGFALILLIWFIALSNDLGGGGPG